MGEGLGGGDAAQLAGDRLMDAGGICQDLRVPKSQNPIALVLQETTSLGFPRRRAIVLAAVDFQDQPGLVAYKVSNVTTDRHLAAELVPLYLMRAQCLPEPPFRLGHALA